MLNRPCKIYNIHKQANTENKITFSSPQWMGCPDVTSRLVFPVKILLLIGTSRWMQGLSNLVTRPESNSESWPTDSLKSMHSFIYTVNTAGAPALLPCGRPRGGRKKREVLLNSVSLSVKTGGTTGMPTSESTTASPPHILNTHSPPHSFSHSVGAVNRHLCGHWRFSYERNCCPWPRGAYILGDGGDQLHTVRERDSKAGWWDRKREGRVLRCFFFSSGP